mgnify:CR=1 FL=1
MKDKLIMENVLLLLKGTCEVYVHGTQEASNQKVHDTLYNGLDETLKMQYEVYNKMVEHGWYQVQNIQNTEINKTLTQLQNKEA